MNSLDDLIKNSNVPAEPENIYLEDKDKGLKLIAGLISPKYQDGKVVLYLRELEMMIENEFLGIAEKDMCPGSAIAYSSLQKAFSDLIEIANFPELENKYTVAIGGQFSSGKSKFLNALLKNRSLLPTETSATTSIPTYIMQGKNDSVFALNNYQNKAEIDHEAFHAITHKFKERYDIAFSHILKLITILRESFPWPNITFLDTPGYSKADSVKSKSDNTDENIAREHLRVADYLIWLTSIRNGTVPREDINFIKSLDYHKPVLFVMNKADEVPESKIRDIIKVAKKDLTANKIPVYDVIAYSSMKKKEYSDGNSVLEKFLKEISLVKPCTKIHHKFAEIMDEYIDYHKSEVQLIRNSRETINVITIDAHVKEEQRTILKADSKKKQKVISLLKNSETNLVKLKERMMSKINEIFKELNIELREGHISMKDNRKTETQVLRIKAYLQINNDTGYNSLPSLKNIPGEIKEIKAIGVIVKSNQSDDVLIHNSDLVKQLPDYAQVLYQEQDVTVDYLSKNQAVVKIEI